MNEWGQSHHLPSPTVGELPTMGVWSALDHVTWVVAILPRHRFKSSDLRGQESSGLRNYRMPPLLTAQKSSPLLSASQSILPGSQTPCCSDPLCSMHTEPQPGHNHLGPERVHGPQAEWWLSPEASWLRFKHQSLLKPQREVIPECH